MSFMEPEVWHEDYYAIETNEGTKILPESACGIDVNDIPDFESDEEMREFAEEHFRDYLGSCGKIFRFDTGEGYLYQLSAPGYLDQTDIGVAGTEIEACEELLSLYGNDDTPEDWEREIEDRIAYLKHDKRS